MSPCQEHRSATTIICVPAGCKRSLEPVRGSTNLDQSRLILEPPKPSQPCAALTAWRVAGEDVPPERDERAGVDGLVHAVHDNVVLERRRCANRPRIARNSGAPFSVEFRQKILADGLAFRRKLGPIGDFLVKRETPIRFGPQNRPDFVGNPLVTFPGAMSEAFSAAHKMRAHMAKKFEPAIAQRFRQHATRFQRDGGKRMGARCPRH